MLIERPNFEPQKDNQAYEIVLGVPFKPFKKARKFYWPKKDEQPLLIPESYTHTLALRKEVLLYNIKGYIDVITENPTAIAESFFSGFPLEKPLGDTAFSEVVRSRNDVEYIERPCILRFSFPLHTPAEYVKLLNSYVDVKLGKEQYVLYWNIDMPLVRGNMEKLRNNENVIVTEKNLFNLKWSEEVPEDEKGEIKELGRATFIWFPRDLRKLRKINLTFRKFDDGKDSYIPEEPVEAQKELVPLSR